MFESLLSCYGQYLATPRHSERVARGRIAGLIALLSQDFVKLENGWNSYPAPNAIAIENSKALVTTAGDDDIIPERVEPSAMGGMGVTFSSGQREVAVEFYNDGKAHALFADDETDEMFTRAVHPEVAGFRDLLQEVRKHLYRGRATAFAFIH